MPDLGPDARSWPRRPAASACARRRRRRAPTSCSSTSRTPARRSPRRRPGRIAVGALTELDWGRTVRAVRINGLDTAVVPRRHHRGRHRRPRRARRAHRARRPARPATCGGSTCCSPSSRRSSGCTKRIGLEVLIEEAEGLANAAEIARASDRLEAIIFGAGDLSASLHARVDGNFDPVERVPRRLLALRPRPGPHRGPGRRHRRHRRAVPRLPGPRRLPARARRTPACSASTASGRSTPSQIADRQRGVLADRRRDRRRRRGDRDLPARRRPTASAPSAATAGSSTRPTCAWPRTCSTRRRWPGRATMSDGPVEWRRRRERRRPSAVGWCSGPPATSASRSLRAVIEHPQLDAGRRATSTAPTRSGRTPVSCAASAADRRRSATDDIDESSRSAPDCVLYMPQGCDFDEVCRLLASGVERRHHPRRVPPPGQHGPGACASGSRPRARRAARRSTAPAAARGSSPRRCRSC